MVLNGKDHTKENTKEFCNLIFEHFEGVEYIYDIISLQQLQTGTETKRESNVIYVWIRHHWSFGNIVCSF